MFRAMNVSSIKGFAFQEMRLSAMFKQLKKQETIIFLHSERCKLIYHFWSVGWLLTIAIVLTPV
jgi:hypothetical protein